MKSNGQMCAAIIRTKRTRAGKHLINVREFVPIELSWIRKKY